MVQFIKSMEYHELRTLRGLDVPVHQFGLGCFIRGEPATQDKQMAERGLGFAREVMARGDVDLLILDDINLALNLGLLAIEDVIEAVRTKPNGLEIVCTGRGAPKQLWGVADLVTEMVNHKHYFETGITARDGIER
jgi:cob(I)alamin adenosyltransferase